MLLVTMMRSKTTTKKKTSQTNFTHAEIPTIRIFVVLVAGWYFEGDSLIKPIENC